MSEALPILTFAARIRWQLDATATDSLGIAATVRRREALTDTPHFPGFSGRFGFFTAPIFRQRRS